MLSADVLVVVMVVVVLVVLLVALHCLALGDPKTSRPVPVGILAIPRRGLFPSLPLSSRPTPPRRAAAPLKKLASPRAADGIGP